MLGAMTHAEAGPALRNALVRHVARAAAADDERERARHLDVATGLREALTVLLDAADTTVTPGIAGRAALPPDAEVRAREWLQEDADHLLGTPALVAAAEEAARGGSGVHETDLPRTSDGRDVHDL
ncbi:hypothetical protein SAMN05428996_1384 [Quadrisphaera sp. DSM 44207]|nr:hypothetical protein SAMN05428996_1384 [Quadrisphaera sp. DSM 44207]